MKRRKWNNLKFGLVCGIIGPFIGFWLYWLGQSASGRIHHTFSGWINFVLENTGIQSAVVSLSLLFNLGIFFFFIWKKADMAARGVLMATLIYAPLVVYLKFG